MSFRSLLVPVALASALALPAMAFAQGVPPSSAPAQPATRGERQHRGGFGFMRMLRSLNLTSQQQAQLRQVMQQFRQSHPRGSQPDPQARQQLRNQILAILTPQQRQQFQKELQERRGGHGK